MRKIKLIALDLDGTLLNDKGKIPEENIRVLNEFSKRGCIIVLSSGRMTECVSPFADKLGIDCPLIIYNGAMVKAKKKENRKVLYHNSLPSKYADDIVDYCIENKFHLNYYLNDILYAQQDKELKKYAFIYSSQTKAKFHFLKDFKKMKGSSPTKLILITDNIGTAPTKRIGYSTAKPISMNRTRDFQYKFFSGKFKGKLNLFKTNPEYLEFLNKDVDKGVGLKELAKFYEIDIKEIIAFGDGENDIAMLKVAGVGVALSNAKEKVKRIANFISDYDNNNSGIAKFLSRYL